MFVIAGLRARNTTAGTGVFWCPNEGGDRRYHRMRSRRWFTLFFVPLIPLGQHREWVRCAACGATYDTDVLARHPAARP